jgi:outer membrane protein assembly factor BamB
MRFVVQARRDPPRDPPVICCARAEQPSMRKRSPSDRGATPSPLRALLLALHLAPGLLAGLPVAAGAGPQELLYSTEGNRLRRFDVDSIAAPPLLEDVLVPSASDGEQGGGAVAGRARDVNGMICRLPDGSGRFVLGEDTGQPHPRPGWGVFTRDGLQVGKLTPTAFVAQAEPFGCAFDSTGRLFTTEVGNQGFGTPQGQLIVWFPPYDVFPGPPGAYPDTDAVGTNFCKLAVISTATGIALDGQDRVYVASPSSSKVFRYSGDFPTGPDAAGGCGRSDALGSPLVDEGRIVEEVFVDAPEAAIPSGIARAPNGNWYVSSVLLGTIAEFDPDGAFVRSIAAPPEPVQELPKSTGSPQSLAVDHEGSLYYADLDLQGDFFSPEPGPDGKVRRIAFDANGDPLPPVVVRAGLDFPDGVALLPGDFEPAEWRSYAGGPERTFFNDGETILGPGNVGDLRVRWRFPTGSIITASPTVALVDVPGEGAIQVVYFLSWDLNLYAVRLADGSELWRFATDDQPGASFPATASVDVSEVDGTPRVFVGQGEVFYSLDAATGQELWRFTAGTGCGGESPPGLCGFDGERNEIESSAVVHEGLVYFGMDVNDVPTGKGGVFALDARDGRLRWFFDLESGETCRPFESDDVRRFDGYHTEAELGLDAGFLATRPGCDFDRTPTGCGNVWSSPALDAERELLYVASSNCDTDLDPGTSVPPPPMPDYDEAVFALGLDGTPAWRWRPREIDNDDLAFGATPNLFTIELLGESYDVVGVGNKDGTYYVLDRDGVNGVNGVPAGDPNPFAFPYWIRNVVPGGDIGGILASAAVDGLQRRIYFSTAPGRGGVNDPGAGPPQTPTVHALDMDSGALVWNNGGEADIQASFGPASAIPGLAFFGHVPVAILRAHETAGDSGARLANFFLDFYGLASGPVVVQGTLLVGNGIGVRTDTGSGPPVVSLVPSALTAFCVPGQLDCAPCRDGFDNDGDDATDFPDDAGCTSDLDRSEDADCDDGLDNDDDGARDFPGDAGCASAQGPTEVPEPASTLLGAWALALVSLLARRNRRPVRRPRARLAPCRSATSPRPPSSA